MEFEKAITEYIAWKQSYTTRAGVSYLSALQEFNKFVKKAVEEVEINDIVSYQISLNRKYRPATVALQIVAIRDFFKYWGQQGIKTLNTYFIRIPRVPYHAPTSVTVDEYKALCDAVGVNGIQLLVIKFLMQTGVRVSELCDIRLSDITEKMECNIETKKTKRPRWIFWCEDTDKLLREHIANLLEVHPRATHVFTNSDGEQVTPRSIQRWVKAAVGKAKVRTTITPHSFRHGTAHNILAKGGNPKDVQEILGHNDPRSSFKYMVLNSVEIKTRARQLLKASYESVDKPS